MARYGLREVADVTFYDYNTGNAVMYLDSLKISDLTVAAKSVDAVGGKGANRLLEFDYGKTVTFDVQDALLNPTALGMLTGYANQTGTQTIAKREVLTAVGTTTVTVTTSQAPLAGTVQIYTTDDGYDQLTQLTPTQFSVSGSTITLQSGSGVTAGNQVIVYYQYNSGSQAWMTEITANNFPGYYKVVGDTLVRNNTTGLDEAFQMTILKAKLMPGFKITLQAEGNAPTVFDFKLEAYKPNNSNVMVTMVKY